MRSFPLDSLLVLSTCVIVFALPHPFPGFLRKPAFLPHSSSPQTNNSPTRSPFASAAQKPFPKDSLGSRVKSKLFGGDSASSIKPSMSTSSSSSTSSSLSSSLDSAARSASRLVKGSFQRSHKPTNKQRPAWMKELQEPSSHMGKLQERPKPDHASAPPGMRIHSQDLLTGEVEYRPIGQPGIAKREKKKKKGWFS